MLSTLDKLDKLGSQIDPNTPTWADAPEWANYLTYDYSGWWWWEAKPEVMGYAGYMLLEFNRSKLTEASLKSKANSESEFYIEQRPL